MGHPAQSVGNVYLHEIRKSDDDRALHDHPWDNVSFLLAGGYIEHTPEGAYQRQVGDVVQRRAEAMHRLEVAAGLSAVSLFITGPKVREWGFACGQGWVRWQDFTNAADPSQIGRGCGEFDDPTPASEQPVRAIEAASDFAPVAALLAPIQRRFADLLHGYPDKVDLIEATEISALRHQLDARIEMMARGLHVEEMGEG
ncbi:hypothetical protein [Croceicoccus sp. BE223]|uniref:hypothetical protein n=1 Tax=Croceicoccus sp. BE223 TaxID=2817716 RepID=UPI002860352C|nr:hypothetical protein [Croceicoccus sp. BE223]MDR7102970.1 hypothetical protein [Croceicoccus sp. BE223]